MFGTPSVGVPAGLTQLDTGPGYLAAIRGLSPEAKAEGTAWLQGIVSGRLEAASALVPALGLGD